MTPSTADLKALLGWRSPYVKGLAMIGAIGFGIAGTMYAFQTRPSAAPTSVSSSAVLPQIKTVTALGRLEPKGTVIKLAVPTASNGNRVEKVLVQEGETVKAGQIVAILDNRDRLQAALTEAEERVNVAQARLAQVQAGAKSGEIQAQSAKVQQTQVELQKDRIAQADEIARLQAQWEGDRLAQQATIRRLDAARQNAQLEFNRYANLQAQGAIAQSELDSKRLALQTATRQVEEAQAVLTRINLTAQRQINQAQTALQRIIASGRQQSQAASATLDQVREVRPVDVQVAQAERDQAIAAVQQAKASLDQAYVKAPQDGVIMKIHTYAGEVVSATDGILDLGQTQRMHAVAEVYESDLTKVKVGQKAKITSDSLGVALSGTVERKGWQIQRQNVINTDPAANIDARVVEVHIVLDEASSRKAAQFTNLQVQVAIEL
ncbi:MAG TPA: HlyD family efflux transporter periplasmic adaptor subunit [Stenomitos sp.]